MNRNEILILAEMFKMDCCNEVKAITIGMLSNLIKLSYSTTRNLVKVLVIVGHIANGLKNSKSETYYLTSKGIDKIKSIKGMF